MSTTYRPALVGLVSPGLFWLAASVAHGQGSSPKPQGLPAIPAPVTASAPPVSTTYAALLLDNGTVVRGEIVDDPIGGVYRLKMRSGTVPYPKSRVRRVGQSLDDLYRYQAAALPVGDPEERMKLVRWCLTEHLPAEAREQLAEVIRLCPNDAEAARMAVNLDANNENNPRDAAVRQTAGEPADAPDAAPNDLPPAIRQKLLRGFNNTLPEIFDLPPAQAVARASEFTEVVQVILQKNCTGCHNEKYRGTFQLAEVRTLKELRNPEVARANLDAVLHLVNPDDPARSDLLSICLVPHAASKNPIFRGANDPQYQRLSRWVRSLRPAGGPSGAANRSPATNRFGNPLGGEGVTPASFAPGSSGGFGSERPGENDGAVSSGIDRSSNRLPAVVPPGARRTVREINESADFSKGQAGDFPLPITVGGVEVDRKPITAPPPARRGASRPAPLPGGSSAGPGVLPNQPPIVAASDEADAASENPGVPPTQAKVVGPGVVAVDVNEDLNHLPGMNQPKYPTFKKEAAPAAGAAAGAGDEAGAAAGRAKPPAGATATPGPAPKKKPQIDPADLEKLMRSRAGSP